MLIHLVILLGRRGSEDVLVLSILLAVALPPVVLTGCMLMLLRARPASTLSEAGAALAEALGRSPRRAARSSARSASRSTILDGSHRNGLE